VNCKRFTPDVRQTGDTGFQPGKYHITNDIKRKENLKEEKKLPGVCIREANSRLNHAVKSSNTIINNISFH
jgi:hypothetical protein